MDYRRRNSFLGTFWFFLAVLAGLILVSSCQNRGAVSLRRHDLFSIPLGTLPGELDWFYRDGFRMAGTADIQTQDGLIFVSGGESGKVMVFNSYGDLFTFVYDPARSTPPATVSGEEQQRSISSWPFRSPRVIAPFEDGFLVEDGVEQDRRVEDGAFGGFYDRVVLRFDRDGKYLGHLGREGYSGSPFPYIANINVRENGGIVVTSRMPGAWMSYWYNAEGHPVATVRIQEDQLPGLEEGGKVAVYSVRPDPVDWSLHIRVDVYLDSKGSGEPEPRLYTLNLNSLVYTSPIILNYVEGDEDSGIPSIPPEYLGTTSTGHHLMLTSQGPEIYRMNLIDTEGRIVENRRIKVDASSSIYRRFRMQNNGLLTGIFFGPSEASVSWWRVDKLTSNGR